MRRLSRPAVKCFEPTERLFLRVTASNVKDGSILPSGVRFPNQSVNRERFSKPTDVILPDGKSFEWLLLGVAAFVSDDIPRPIPDGDGSLYEFTVEHDPEEANYSHSELRAYKNGERKNKGSRKVEKVYRAALAKKLSLVVPPVACDDSASTGDTQYQ